MFLKNEKTDSYFLYYIIFSLFFNKKTAEVRLIILFSAYRSFCFSEIYMLSADNNKIYVKTAY